MASIFDELFQSIPTASNAPAAQPAAPVPQISEAQQLQNDLALMRAGNRNDTLQGLITISQQRGNGLTQGNQLIEDFNTLSGAAFQQRHGTDVYQEMVASRQRANRVNSSANAERSVPETLRDVGVGVASGLVQGVGSLATLGLSAVSDDAAVKSAEIMGDIKEFSDSLQSDALNRRRGVDALRAQLDSMDNEAKFKADQKKDGALIANLRSFGRGVISGANRLIEDPAMLEQGISEGVGSLLVGGPVTKAVVRGGALLTNSARVTAALEKAAFPGVIGALEGGGAFTDAAQEIMATPHEQLAEQSPRFRELIAGGMTPDEAQVELAARAGNVASAIAAPIGALTGRLVEGLERAPLAAAAGRAPGSVIGNSAREFIEEAVQSGAGEFAGNVGQVVSGANPDQNLIEGVGDAAIQGGIFGAGTGPAIQGPSAALKQAAKAAGATIRHLDQKFTAAGESLMARNAAESTVSAEQVAPAVAEIAAQAPVVAEGIKALAAEAPVPSGSDEAPVDVQALADRVVQAAQVSPEEIQGLSENVRDTVAEFAQSKQAPLDRFEMVKLMAQLTEMPDVPQEDRVSAATYILKNMAENNKLFSEDLPALLSNVSHDRPEYQALLDFDKTLLRIQKVPEIQKAIKWAQDEMQIPAQDLSQVEMSSPKGQQLVDNAVNVAVYAPQAFNPEVGLQILRQADQGTIELTPERRDALTGATEFINNIRAAEARQQQIDAGSTQPAAQPQTQAEPTVGLSKKALDLVSKQIETEGGSSAHQLSLRAHAAGINQAISINSRKALVGQLESLTNFAQSHINKVEAFNKSAAAGDGRNVQYQYLNAAGKFSTHKKGVGVNLGNAGSEKFARTVHNEATMIADTANSYIRQFPKLGLQEIVVPPLVLAKQGGSSTVPATPAPVQATTPEPVVVQKPELPRSVVSQQPAVTQAPQPKQPLKARFRQVLSTFWTPEQVDYFENNAPVPMNDYLKRLLDNQSKANPGVPRKDLIPNRLRNYTPQQVLADTLNIMFPEIENTDRPKPAPRTRKPKITAVTETSVTPSTSVQTPVIEEAPAELQEQLTESAAAPVEPAVVVSRVTVEQARSLSDDGLNQRINALLDKGADGIATPEDDATYAVLDAEAVRRDQQAEAEAAEEQAREGEEFGDQATDDVRDLASQIDEIFQEPEDETGEASIGAKFMGLARMAGNQFAKAFRVNKKRPSRLLDQEAPMRSLYNALADGQSLFDYLGYDPKYTVNQTNINSYRALMRLGGSVMVRMNQRLQAKLADKGKSGRQVPMEERLNNSDPVVNRMRDLRALNIVEKTDNGFAYNSTLLQAAVLAGLDWVAQGRGKDLKVEKYEMAGIMGIPDESLITDEMLTEFNAGSSMSVAKKSLAENIQKFWGLVPNFKGRRAYTVGIAEAIAAELLHGMDTGLDAKGFSTNTNGLLLVHRMDLDDRLGFKAKKPNRVVFGFHSDDVQDVLRGLNGAKKLLTDMAMVRPEKGDISIGEPVTEIDNTVLRQRAVSTTKAHREVLENLQNTKFLPVMTFFNYVQALGKAAYVSAMSGVPYKDGDLNKDYAELGMNKNHHASVHGRWMGLANDYDNIVSQMAEVNSAASKRGIAPEEMGSFYKYHINKMGRQQMAGPSNPQASKLARHVFLPTKSKALDLSKPENKDYRLFMKAVAQGLGVKTETDKGTFDQSIAFIKKEALTEGGKFNRLYEAFKGWLRDGQQSEMPGELLNELMQAGLSDHGQYSLLELARYQLAAENGADLTKWETSNYLESDGKTNGVVNSLFLFATGPIIPSWLKMVAKGGAFFGRPGKTLNQHYEESDDNKIDIYGEISKATAEKMTKVGWMFHYKYPEVSAQYQAFRRLMASLNADFEYDPDKKELTIKRGLAKSPLTKANYAAGTDTLTNTFADDIISALYEKITDHAQGRGTGNDVLYPPGSSVNFVSDLDALTGAYPFKEMGVWGLASAGANEARNFDLEYTLSRNELFALKENIKMFLTHPMQKAIKDLVDEHTTFATTAMQNATQFQSVIMKGIYANKYAARVAEKMANPEKFDYHNGDLLSQEEEDHILKEMGIYAPVIDTGSQRYMLSGNETGDLFEHISVDVGEGRIVKVPMPGSFSRSLTGDLETPAFIYGPTEAGVRARPTMNIGSGDGQMMLYIMAVKEIAERSLGTFDGLHLPIDLIEKGSQVANEAVYKTWTSAPNPLRAVSDSYNRFMLTSPVEALFPKGTNEIIEQWFASRIEALSKGVEENELDEFPATPQQYAFLEAVTQAYLERKEVFPVEFLTPKQAKAFLQQTARSLEKAADDVDIRRQVYAETGMSVDQMSGGEMSHTVEGKLDLTNVDTLGKLAGVMNRRYQELKTEASTKRRAEDAAKTPIEGVNEEVLRTSLEKTRPQHYGVKQLHAKGISSLVRRLTDKLPADQKYMLREAARTMEASGYQMLFGEQHQLDAWEQTYNGDRFVRDDNGYSGKIDPISKLMFINNLSAETIFHELTHAATVEKLWLAYNKPDALTKEENDAVKRLDALMNQWLEQDFSLLNDAAKSARLLAESAVHDFLNKGHRDAAVSEFMAWVMNNQNLADVARQTKVTNPIARIIGKALQALKEMFWGKGENGKAKGPAVSDDMLSNIRFNTRVLMVMPTPVELLKGDFAAVSRNQSAFFGNDSRLADLREQFGRKIVDFIRESDDRVLAQSQADAATTDAIDLADEFAFHFPAMRSMQAKSTFQMIQKALALETRLNPNALLRLEEMYTHTIAELRREGLVIPTGNQAQDEYDAEQRMKLLTGVLGVKEDAQGRTSLLSSFLALALVDNDFRDILARLDKPKSDRSDVPGLDGFLETNANRILDSLSVRLSGERSTDLNVQQAIDSLTQNMIRNVGDQRSYLELQSEGLLNKADTYIADVLQNGSDAVITRTNDLMANSQSRIVRAAARIANVAATVVNEQASNEAIMGAVSWMNRRENLNTTRELLNDIAGRTRENAPIFDMVSKVRSWIQQTRQRFREEIPEILAKQFSRPVTPQEWTSMFRSIAKTDLPSLVQSLGVDGTMDVLTNEQGVVSQIQRLEAGIRTAAGNRAARIIEKSRQLANFMNTGEHGANLLPNAKAIAHLYSERGMADPNTQSPELIEQIDRMVTLYAVQNLDQAVKDTMASLIQDEDTGVKFVLTSLRKQREDELVKTRSVMAQNNYYKGYIPSERENGGEMLIAHDRDHAQLVSRGFTRIGAYSGSSADRWAGNRSYYYSPVSGRAPFMQGVLQTVHLTASGVDPQTGFTVGEVNAGIIQDPIAISVIQSQLRNQGQTRENLRAVHDEDGNVVAYERMSDSRITSTLKRNTDLARMMGAWGGRQAEEHFAQEYNRDLIDRLHEIWERDKGNRSSEFVNLFDLGNDPDPVLVEAAKLVPWYTRNQIEALFGRKVFMVRRDMLKIAIGERQASVGDLFTGNTRWKPGVAERFEKIAMGIFDGPLFRKMGVTGNDAYRILVSGEQHVQEIVTAAKTMIVVKSVIVPAANIISNMVQLLNRGVPLRDVVRGFAGKTAEINTYIKNRAKEIELEARFQAADGAGDTQLQHKLAAEIQSIKDGYRRMSIWPLIDAGEFSAISTGQVTVEDLAIADGKWGNYVEKLIAKLPKGVQTPARYAMVTRDTALFQGLARATQYGDFVAKAVLYDHEVKVGRKKTAISSVNEAFVNYNISAGRSRHYLESVGLLWFWSYKLRSIKEAAYMMRHNPLRSLLMAAVPTGSPITDNFLASMWDGRLDYSMGPSMGFNSFSLNPWVNAFQ
ncbi:hypothetical protein [Mesorhizobium sp. CN2-181]|uniref:hypothetical protein n=1 Tax=Mesorhizobium yinganensis TaxID=3157707 RepID=UPI0032B84604